MKKYFLHDGIESSGPFDLNELKSKNITKRTPVWYEGMENWKFAGDIEELKNLFAAVPPPISSFTTPTTVSPKKTKAPKRKIFGLSKKTFFTFFGVLIFIIGISVLNILQEKRSEELKIKNHQTEIENYQYVLQQKEIENQKKLVEEAEKAQAKRILEEKKNTYNNRLLSTQQKITDYQNLLKETEKKLDDASGFKFLRTAAERNNQITTLRKNIDSIKIEIVKLKNESNHLQLELDKMQ